MTWAMWILVVATLEWFLQIIYYYFVDFWFGYGPPWRFPHPLSFLLRLSFIPLVLYAADRVRLGRPHFARNLTFHLAASSVASALNWLIADVIARSIHIALPPSPWQIYFVPWYWAVVGLFYIHLYHSESAKRLAVAEHLRTALAEARLKALRSQLNPHFLFNTLNSASVLAMKGEQDQVAETLASLSNLLRTALDETRPASIPLEEELEFIDGYLDIQRIRFADRLTIRRDIGSDAMKARIPAMILEPVVENAIEHGVSETGGPCIIAIEAHRVDGMLRIRVSDNGPGFPTAAMGGKTRGIGLTNTSARLQQLYGNDHRIEYGRSELGGASVMISVPFCDSDDVPVGLVTTVNAGAYVDTSHHR